VAVPRRESAIITRLPALQVATSPPWGLAASSAEFGGSNSSHNSGHPAASTVEFGRQFDFGINNPSHSSGSSFDKTWSNLSSNPNIGYQPPSGYQNPIGAAPGNVNSGYQSPSGYQNPIGAAPGNFNNGYQSNNGWTPTNHANDASREFSAEFDRSMMQNAGSSSTNNGGAVTDVWKF